MRALSGLAAAMRRDGAPAETIARALHAERRRLAGQFKELTPEPLRTRLHARSLATHGDPLGPSIARLRSGGKSWEEIIEGACRPRVMPPSR